MKKQIVADGKARYLIVTEAESQAQTAEVFLDHELMEKLDSMGLSIDQDFYPAQNDNGKWHAFYFLGHVA